MRRITNKMVSKGVLVMLVFILSAFAQQKSLQENDSFSHQNGRLLFQVSKTNSPGSADQNLLDQMKKKVVGNLPNILKELASQYGQTGMQNAPNSGSQKVASPTKLGLTVEGAQKDSAQGALNSPTSTPASASAPASTDTPKSDHPYLTLIQSKEVQKLLQQGLSHLFNLKENK